MSFHTDDTICAIATASGRAARGMVRISGPAAVAIVKQVFEPSDDQSIEVLQSAAAVPGRVCIGLSGANRSVPCDLFLWPTTRSYTREPVAEFHTIGSRPVLESLLAAACRAGARLAEPGEFTMRAFLAGRIDLTQAEAVLGVIDARGAADLDAALAQLSGGLARPLHELRQELLQLLAEIEAGLDFVEEDIEFISSAELVDRIQSADELLDRVQQQMTLRHVANEEAQIALVGPPNAGKSSLFNAMTARFGGNANREENPTPPALVSPLRGTTRDYLVAPILLVGIRCQLIDTAGVDGDRHEMKATSSIESLAQSLAAEQSKRATIRAVCIEAPCVAHDSQWNEITKSIRAVDCDIIVLTKADLTPYAALPFQLSVEIPAVLTSSRTGYGLDEFAAAIRDRLDHTDSAQCGQVVSATANRCRESVRLSRQSLVLAAELVRAGGGNELVAIELRAALAELGKVVGAVYTDDLLDRIFGTFCIGK
ncbi:MAG TPA: GTPase [Lacipirellulaceae bacterium]|nr:GTPase [Lacipirellulaceae bacterium]